MIATQRSWWRALILQRCPRCRVGRVFRGSVTMNETCPECGLMFAREEGYFVGAMYVSYGLATLFLGALLGLGALLLPEWNLTWVLLLATVFFLPLVPAVFRYSRLIWMYFDRWIWPDNV